MARLTVDYGIDLGTTNTVVAVKDRRKTTVLNGPDNSAIIPSAVHVTSDGNVIVGAGAKALANQDPGNTATRWKRTMGRGAKAKKEFAASGSAMRPEELSAEVLKTARQTIRDRRNEDPREIVITIPAGFNAVQTKATQAAAKLAGFDTCYLLTEPIAAALAYGADEVEEDATWLIYDFGGGTFDATVIELLEDMPTVVSHAGNNFLGGTDIDFDIISKILRPAFIEGRDLPKHDPEDPYWRGIDARMLEAAEAAKIRVCQTREDANITLEALPLPGDGSETVDFVHTLSVEDVKQLTAPYVASTVSLCQECLSEGKVEAANIDKVILVGGTSMNPWVREAVADVFGCPLEISIDPMSVVAEGAAIFAAQLTAEPQEVSDGTYQLRVTSALVADVSPVDFVAKVLPPKGESLPSGMEIEFVDSVGEWTSGRVPVKDNGTVRTSLRISETEGSEFKVTLTRADGTKANCEPDTVPISRGIVAPNPPLSHHFGVGLATGELKPILQRGQVLPARGRGVVRTTRELKKGDSEDSLLIPIFEGTNIERVNRNAHLITLKISGADVPRNIPAGTEVEVKLTCDLRARDISAELFFPAIDEHLVKAQIQLDDRVPDSGHIEKSLEGESARLSLIEERAHELADPEISGMLTTLAEQENTGQISRLLTERGDADALTKAEEQIRRFAEELDTIEDALEFPELVADIEARINTLEEDAARLDPSMLDGISGLRGTVSQAVRDRSAPQLRSLLQEVERQASRLRENDVEFWGMAIGYLKSREDELTDPNMGRMLFDQIDQAIQANNLEAVKAACRQLSSILPPDANSPLGGKISDVT